MRDLAVGSRSDRLVARERVMQSSSGPPKSRLLSQKGYSKTSSKVKCAARLWKYSKDVNAAKLHVQQS